MSVDINSTTGIPNMDNLYENISFNPILITVVVAVIILYFLLFSSLGGAITNNSYGESTSYNSDGGFKFLGLILVSVFLVLLLINGFSYFFNINVIASIKDFFTRKPTIDLVVDSDLNKSSGDTIVPEIKSVEQVYHIPNNKYTYDDAKAICNAYGGRLANYKEIEKAYNDGANWCSFGWSADQMALYPTQYKNWKKLQEIAGHEHDCGRPGINGGFIDNPIIRFGVNCYGYKPKITPYEAELMENAPPFPLTQSEVNFQKRVDYWKSRIGDILIAPFNRKNWSQV